MDRKELMDLADEYALCAMANPLSMQTTQARRELRAALDAVVNQQMTTAKPLTDEERADCGLLSELDAD